MNFHCDDSRTTEELIKLALNAEDEDEVWELVPSLHFRGNREVLEAAQKLCESEIFKERKLGVDILGQLGIPQRTFLDESLSILFKLLDTEKDSEVLYSIGIALGHIGDKRAIEPLVKLKNHPIAEVRYGVTFGISGQEDTLAISTLIELAADENENVRNWATFGLGSQIYTDTIDIREALFQRLVDEEQEIRGEALVGLARRGDERVVEPLIKELSSDSVGILAVEAAKEIGDAQLYSALRQLQEWWNVDKNLLAEAINSCEPK
ncbi:MAG: HEAT repeat domain-containing protein [Potamolinea sp.]